MKMCKRTFTRIGLIHVTWCSNSAVVETENRILLGLGLTNKTSQQVLEWWEENSNGLEGTCRDWSGIEIYLSNVQGVCVEQIKLSAIECLLLTLASGNKDAGTWRWDSIWSTKVIGKAQERGYREWMETDSKWNDKRIDRSSLQTRHVESAIVHLQAKNKQWDADQHTRRHASKWICITRRSKSQQVASIAGRD